MYGNMNFAKIADEFIVRGKRAQRELFQLFYKANINNLDVRLKLFDSLVKSVVMYCSHIWGIALTEKFKAFQCSYLRQIFKLPSYTPHWFLFLVWYGMIYSVLIDVAVGLYNLGTLILNINYCVVESETQSALDILNCLNV
jgi:hypothetical protein